MLITNKTYDSLTDEEGCKSVTSYVLAHKDARTRETGEVVILQLHFKGFQFLGGEGILKILMNTSSYCVCAFFRN